MSALRAPRRLPRLPLPRRALHTRPLRVLGLESSADDSCAAVVTSDRRVLSSVVLKQHAENERFGGIHPLRAVQIHMGNMPRAIALALEQSGLSISDIDAVAYTRGPGMPSSLSVCASSARAIAAAANKPVLGIHHMQAHALTPLLTEDVPPGYPFLTLLVSGGHTLLVLARAEGEFEILVDTLDNAVGSAFDRTARALRLPHDSELGLGPVLERYAAAEPLAPYDSRKLRLTRPLSLGDGKDRLAFSFAGLIAATERLVAAEMEEWEQGSKGTQTGEGPVPLAIQRALAKTFQETAVAHIIAKIRQCIALHGLDVRGLVVSGGVGSNKYLRKELAKMLEEYPGVTLHYPPVELCTDNAAMIAWVGILRLQAGLKGEPFGLPLRPKWSLEDLYDDVPPECYTQKEE